MDIVNLCEMLGIISGKKINPIQFPNQDGILTKLEITTGIIETGGVYDFNIELGVKAAHPRDAERTCLEFINAFHKKTNVEHEGYQLILMLAEKPYPFYVGELEDQTQMFTCDFRLLTTKLN